MTHTTMKRILFLLACSFFAGLQVNAQQQLPTTKFKLGGLGRSILSYDRISGDYIGDDTLNPTEGVGGYTLFDLRADLAISNHFQANTILRVKNPYGSFFGDRTFFEFRQMQFFGEITKNISYKVGDIYVGGTNEFLFWNPEEMYNTFEADIFSQKRDILEYENFIVGNQWRLQGFEANTSWDSVGPLHKLIVNAGGYRTNPSNDKATADRVVATSTIKVVQAEKLTVGFNYVGLLDIPVSTTNFVYQNNILHAEASYLAVNNDNIALSIGVQGASSGFKVSDNVIDSTVERNDFFYNGELGIAYKPAKVKLTLGYRDVGAQYYNPAAQTGRVNVGTTPNIFPTVTNNSVDRTQMLYDRVNEEGIYYENLQTTNVAYRPQYTNATPFGMATGNRRGLKVGLATDTSLKVLKAEVMYESLSEVIGEGTGSVRKFGVIRGGFLLNVNKLIDFKRLIQVNAGYASENTSRDGDAAIDFTSSLIDAGLAVETLKKIDLLGGVKLLNANGNEFLAVRNQFNQITSFNTFTYDGTESIYSVGVRFRFAEYAFATANYFMSEVKDNTASNVSYKYDSIFLNFTVQF